MEKLLAAGGFLLDIAAGSHFGDSVPESLPIWLALNVSLLLAPLAFRVCELLVTAVTNAPQVMTLDVGAERF